MRDRLHWDLATLTLLVVPWALVLITAAYVHWLPEIPAYAQGDVAELTSMDRAIRLLANQCGSYPPDFSTDDPSKEIEQYLRSAFPLRDHQRDLPTDIASLKPDTALYYWLRGFYRSKRYPLTGKDLDLTDPDVRREPYYAFDSRRLARTGIYYDAQRTVGSRGGAAFVYFCSDNYEHACLKTLLSGVASPYRQSSTSHPGEIEFMNPESFQILAAGLDSHFGQSALDLDGAARFPQHADNLANFSSRPLGYQAILRHRSYATMLRKIAPIAAVVCLLPYGVTRLFRSRDDGDLILRELIACQLRLLPASDIWLKRLQDDRRRQRIAAVVRLRHVAPADRDHPNQRHPDQPPSAA